MGGDDDAASSSSTSYDVPYDVVGRGDSYELRVYGAYYVAATTYENRERGLATLVEYMEGGNAEGAMYPPTQPLTTRYFEGGKTMELALLGRRARESIADIAAITAQDVRQRASPTLMRSRVFIP